MKRLEIPKSTFIGGYYIDDNVCNAMRDFFFAHPQHIKPTNMDPNNKQCTEFDINPDTNIFEPIYSYMNEVDKCIKTYVDEFIPTMTSTTLTIAGELATTQYLSWFWTEPFNIQHYKKGEGFYRWHYERMADTHTSWRRSLVFMTYLNDVEDGGTEFLNQKCEVKARKNLTLIWPADWTHTHRGVISQTKEKTIITGWIGLHNPGAK